MPVSILHTASHDLVARDRYSRRTALGSVFKLVAAGVVLGGPLGSLASCGFGSTTRDTPTPTPPHILRIIPDNAGMITQVAMLQPMDRLLRGAAISPDGAVIAIGGTTSVQVWDAQTGALLKKLAGHTDQVYGMAWSSASGLLASASFDGTARLWDRQRNQAVHTLNCGSAAAVISVAWSPDGRQIACGLRDGRVFLWDVESAAQRTVLSRPTGQSQGGRYPFAAWGVTWSPDGSRLISTRYDDLLLLWNLASGESRAIPKTDTQPNTVAWAPNGQVFAMTDDEGKVILWDGVTVQRQATFAGHLEGGWSYGLAWSPDSAMVASGRESGVLQVWDARTGAELALLGGHAGPVWALAWSADGSRLVSASDDGTARVWGVLSAS
jgi:WD40 repeat protein